MLTGYSDRLSVAPGERVEFKVSSAEAYRLSIVRLVQGDDSEAGPGYVEFEVDAPANGSYPARVQRTVPGSYVRVEGRPGDEPATGVTLVAWVWPTTPDKNGQGVLTRWAADGTGYGLEIDGGGAVFSVRTAEQTARVRTREKLRRDSWYLLAAGYDAGSGRLLIRQVAQGPLRQLTWPEPVEPPEPTAPPAPPAPAEEAAPPAPHERGEPPPSVSPPVAPSSSALAPLLIGAGFNGRIAAPRWFGRVLDEEELARVAGAEGVGALGGLRADLRGAWDLSPTRPSTLVHDRSGGGRHGMAVNNPTRAVRGPLWDGSAITPAQAPEHHHCRHFHDDDLADAGWETSAVFDVPRDLPSGVYAARLRSGDDEDHLPFVVRPAHGTPAARVLFVLPTLTYLAYANEHHYEAPAFDWARRSHRPLRLDPASIHIREHPEFGHSLYDVHSDGTYTTYSSRLRPILNLRPKISTYWTGAGRHFGADLYMLGWLHREGVPVDVVVDEDVHRDGLDLLGRYDVAVTGSHPEYATEAMLDAYVGYLATGGRMMYLGGNGFRWVTSIDPDAPHIIEVRKNFGVNLVRGFAPLPGEEHHSQTGERGGYWLSRGRASESWIGIGTCCCGWGPARPFSRTDASYDPAVSWVFDGVEGTEIGAFGLGLGGAAGDEMDCVNAMLGTPPDTVILASSRDYSDHYVHYSGLIEPEGDDRRRADMTYLEYEGGGAAFSAGSMCWYPSLAFNGYDNNVAQVTRNVLRRFLERPGKAPR